MQNNPMKMLFTVERRQDEVEAEKQSRNTDKTTSAA